MPSLPRMRSNDGSPEAQQPPWAISAHTGQGLLYLSQLDGNQRDRSAGEADTWHKLFLGRLKGSYCALFSQTTD